MRWIKDGVEVRTAPADPSSHRVLLPSGALFFLKAVQSKKEDDRGTYWCVAANVDGEVVSRKAQLDIASKYQVLEILGLSKNDAIRKKAMTPCMYFLKNVDIFNGKIHKSHKIINIIKKVLMSFMDSSS